MADLVRHRVAVIVGPQKAMCAKKKGGHTYCVCFGEVRWCHTDPRDSLSDRSGSLDGASDACSFPAASPSWPLSEVMTDEMVLPHPCQVRFRLACLYREGGRDDLTGG